MDIPIGLTISQADRRPLYLQIMEQVRRRVALGDWQPGQEIPSIRALAAATRVSVITIKRAYLELEHEGVIVTRQGRGTFVANDVALGRHLREEELDGHLAKAAGVGRPPPPTPPAGAAPRPPPRRGRGGGEAAAGGGGAGVGGPPGGARAPRLHEVVRQMDEEGSVENQ